MVQVIAMVSDAPLFTTANTVRHNIVPAELALNMPASVNAPVPSPAEKVATPVTVAPDAVYESKA